LADQQRMRTALKLDWKYLLMLYLAVLLLVPVEFYRIEAGLPIDVQLDRILAVAIFLLWTASLLVDPDTKIIKSPVGYAVFGFIGVVFLSFILNMQELTETMKFVDALKRLLYIIAVALLFFFVTTTIKRKEQIDSVFRFSVSVAAAISLFCMLEFLTEFNVFRHLHEVLPFLSPSPYKIGSVMYRGGYIRATGPADHPIAMGVILAMFLPLALHYFEFAKERPEKIKYGFYLGAIALATLMTISRTPIVAAVAMLGVYFLYNPSRAMKMGVVLVIVAFVVHMVFPGVLGGLRTYFSLSFLEQNEIANPYGRVADHPRMISLFLERPLYGRGYGWWDNKAMFYVDNQYLKVLVELGVLGALSISWLFYTITREMRQVSVKAASEEKDLIVSILASCVAYIVTLITYDSFGYAQVTYLFFIIAAMGVNLARSLRNRAGNAITVRG